MRGRLKAAALAVLLITTAAGCTRRVQIESEPNRNEAGVSSAAAIDIAGTYDYAVEVDGSSMPGEVVVTRDGDEYRVRMTSSMGAIETRDVRREGNTLTMEATTPAGDADLEMSWRNRNEFVGFGFMGGQAYPMAGTRRP